MFRYDGSAGFKTYDVATDSGGFSTLGVGNGYIFKTALAPGSISPFKTNKFSSQFPDTDIPAPIKLTLTGAFLKDPAALAPTTKVEPRWNLVGPHSETGTNVGLFTAGVNFPVRTWETLIAFRNRLDIDLDSEGKIVTFPNGEARILFETKFRTLLGPDFAPPAGEPIPPGAGLWLFMCEAPDPPCAGGELPPVPR